ncbi:MAG: hypothetical protein AB1571_02480 [Nanoarchaeota archaeon]
MTQKGKCPDYVEFKDWEKLDLRIGTIKAVEDHPDADKLYVLIVKFDDEPDRQLVAGLKEHYKKEELMGKQVVVFVNLKPITLRGTESNGMILAAINKKDKVVLITPEKKIDNNSKVQ